ncbi:hypothetical protein ACE5IS_10410 [Leptospira wolffii]|uniref:DUF4136 domain-containing protein n=1 Tax=Leptospira wolffii TaxID=409998 RepID=A0ABV5BMU0_9LEPT|nr:hypothetical protein [Leptospira wolffii]EPG65374.1 PF13590 domain protein [Leptospira wolffii serovar Khorat str. Khorat-H2]TGL52442.1 hypothetical protein EHQ61_05060 [Leptospira wolffii]
MKFPFIFCILFWIACSPLQVKSQVEIAKSRNLTLYSKTYAFLPFTGEAPKPQIMEHADLIRGKLMEKGYEEVEESRADLLLHYDILVYPRGTVIDPIIELGAFGGWTSRRGMRYHSYGGVSNRFRNVPILGGIGGGFGSLYGYYNYSDSYRGNSKSYYDETFYDVIFKIEIYDGRRYRGLPSSLLLKANVEGEGRSGPLFDVVPYLITSFFKNFPDFSGEKSVVVSEEEVWKEE